MKKILLVCTSLIVAITLLTGCTYKSGNDKIQNATHESIDNAIKKGVTTKAEIRKTFGEPNHIDIRDNGNESWEYNHYTNTQNGTNYIPYVGMFSNSSDNTNKTLSILFNGDVVKTYAFSSADTKSSGGLIK